MHFGSAASGLSPVPAIAFAMALALGVKAYMHINGSRVAAFRKVYCRSTRVIYGGVLVDPMPWAL